MWGNRLRIVGSLIRSIADPMFQQRQWVSRENPNIFSTLGETLAMILDDFDIEETIRLGVEMHAWPSDGEAAIQLRKLRAILLDLPRTLGHQISTRSAIATPEWQAAIDQAKRTMVALEPCIPRVDVQE